MKSKGDKKSTYQKTNIFREIDSTPSKFQGRLWPTNLQEEKEKFLRFGLTPHFQLKESPLDLDKVINKKRGQIRFELLQEAKIILDRVRNKFGDGDTYFNVAFGDVIDQEQATRVLTDYLDENSINGEITIYWTPELTAFAKMMWHGPNLRANRPEARKYTLIIKNCKENQMLRERGIYCLANHEIGTHFKVDMGDYGKAGFTVNKSAEFRMVNDGLQPWFSDRKRFGLRSMTTREYLSSEEGLATIHTILNAKSKFLFRPALQYYTACICASMGFKEAYEHLVTYVKNEDVRWRLVMRVKRALSDPSSNGGYGNDQCYFEGAVEILKNIHKIDFHVLYSGKVCIDEVNRVRRLARLDCIRLPRFMDDLDKYKQSLIQIAAVNKIPVQPAEKPTSAQSKCLLGSSNVRISWMSKLNVSNGSSASKPSARKKRKARTATSTAAAPSEKSKSPLYIHGVATKTARPDACPDETGKISSCSCHRTVVNSTAVDIPGLALTGIDNVDKDPSRHGILPSYRLLRRHQSASNKLGEI